MKNTSIIYHEPPELQFNNPEDEKKKCNAFRESLIQF